MYICRVKVIVCECFVVLTNLRIEVRRKPAPALVHPNHHIFQYFSHLLQTQFLCQIEGHYLLQGSKSHLPRPLGSESHSKSVLMQKYITLYCSTLRTKLDQRRYALYLTKNSSRVLLQIMRGAFKAETRTIPSSDYHVCPPPEPDPATDFLPHMRFLK